MLLAEFIDNDELEAIAICFDNIRKIRNEAHMPHNNDQQLGDLFDQELTNFIHDLTLAIQKKENSFLDKKNATI